MQRISIENYFNAASSGDLTTVQQYIKENEKDPNAINVTDKSDSTALMLAAKNGHNEIAATLCEVPGIVINPLMVAALLRSVKSDKVIHATKSITFEAFINAAKIDNSSIVEKFIRENKNNPQAINAVDKDGLTALCWAAAIASLNCTNALLAEPSVNVFHYKKNTGDSGHNSYLSAFNVYNNDIHKQGGYWSARESIRGLVYAAAVKSLLKMENKAVTPDILEILSTGKQKLFDAIMKLPTKNEIFAALKKIVEEKENSALGKVFCHGKKTFNKGVMARVIAEYEKLCIEFKVTSVIPKAESSFDGLLNMFKSNKKSDKMPESEESKKILANIEGEDNGVESDHESSHSL